MAAAERDPDGVWLRTDEGTQTFAAALGAVARAADVLTELGVRRGDLVVVTARTTPPYLLLWLALAALGAVTVPTDPASTPAELAGLVGQIRPRLVITDAGSAERRPRCHRACAALGVLDVDELSATGARPPADRAALPSGVGPDDLAVLIPTSGTTGRSKLVMQTHRAYAMAGEGFPFWMELHRRRPADDLAAAVPHQRPGLLGAGVAGVRGRAGPAAAVLGQRLPGLRPPARGDRVQRDRRDARDPDAPAGARRTTPTPRCGSATPARPRPGSGRRRSSAGSGCGSCAATRMSESPYGLIWRHGHPAVRHARLGAAAPEAGRGQRGAGGRRRRPRRRRWARPASCCCATRWSRRATGSMPEETAAAVVDGWLHTGDLVTAERRRHVHLRGAAQGGPAPARPEPVAGRGRGRRPERTPTCWRCAVVGVPSELTEEEVKAFVVPGAGPGARLRRAAGLGGGTAVGVQGAAVLAGCWTRCPARRPSRVAKHRLPAGHPASEDDAQVPPRPPHAPPRDHEGSALAGANLHDHAVGRERPVRSGRTG